MRAAGQPVRRAEVEGAEVELAAEVELVIERRRQADKVELTIERRSTL